MTNSKGYALLLLLGAFIAGGALGFTADRLLDNAGRGGRGWGDYRKRMAEELNLTPAQKAAIDSLMTERHRQIVALYEPLKPQLDSVGAAARSISDSSHEQIKRLLDPSQQAKLDKMRDAARKDRDRGRHRWRSGFGDPKSRPDSR